MILKEIGKAFLLLFVLPQTFHNCSEVSGDTKFTSLVQLKCLRALVDPGEAVGLLAAQVRS